MKQPREKSTRKSGRSFSMPKQRKNLVFERLFNQDEFDQISLGLISHSMDDKWFIFMEDMQLNFHRSWTGHCIYQIRFGKRDAEYVIVEAVVNRKQEEYRNNDDNYDIALLSFLIDNFLLEKNTPFPLPENLPKDIPNGVYQHSVAGTAYSEINAKKD